MSLNQYKQQNKALYVLEQKQVTMCFRIPTYEREHQKSCPPTQNNPWNSIATPHSFTTHVIPSIHSADSQEASDNMAYSTNRQGDTDREITAKFSFIYRGTRNTYRVNTIL